MKQQGKKVRKGVLIYNNNSSQNYYKIIILQIYNIQGSIMVSWRCFQNRGCNNVIETVDNIIFKEEHGWKLRWLRWRKTAFVQTNLPATDRWKVPLFFLDMMCAIALSSKNLGMVCRLAVEFLKASLVSLTYIASELFILPLITTAFL